MAKRAQNTLRAFAAVQRAGFHTSRPCNEILTVRDTLRIAMSDEMRRD